MMARNAGTKILGTINPTKIALVLGGGAFVGGNTGWINSKRNEDPEKDGLANFWTNTKAAGSGAFYGAGATAAMGVGATYGVDKAITTAASAAYKTATWNPIKAWAKARGNPLGIGAGIPKGMRGPVAALAMLALGVGAVAYSSRSNPETAAYASRDDYGETQYKDTSVRDRMSMLNASGNMVFGLHNLRHVSEGR